MTISGRRHPDKQDPDTHDAASTKYVKYSCQFITISALIGGFLDLIPQSCALRLAQQWTGRQTEH